MAPPFDMPHIDLSPMRSSAPYQGEGSPGGSGAARIRAEHGRRLARELDAAYAAADALRTVDERLDAPDGVYVEVELRRGAKADKLERKSDGIRTGAARVEENETRTVALYVPDAARGVLPQIIEDYTNGPLTDKGRQPPNNATVGPIEAFRRARLETFWTDQPEALPTDPRAEMWWGIWCWTGNEGKVRDTAGRLELRVAEDNRWQRFPEVTVIPVLATRAAIELMLYSSAGIAELRRGTDSPVFFVEEVRESQRDWVDDLAERIEWPGLEAPSVCLLDTEVNRAHPLIEPALTPTDLHAFDPGWGGDDHYDAAGHGTPMAGLALHGDLTAPLSDRAGRRLRHRLESVKVLPPRGFDSNEPASYGPITQAAVALAELAAPERTRAFCLAITNEDVSGEIASTWSGAVDQAACGTMPGDDAKAPRRLFFISAGNVPPYLDPEDRVIAEHPIEDPAQAWNAVTVGGYTDLSDIQDEGYRGWRPVVAAGEVSPFSRDSAAWPQGLAPFKPEIVLEAGNRALSPMGTEILNLDSLSLLTTGREVDRLPLVPFLATSAAKAQAARMAARLAAEHSDLWPETIRALMIHSAEWTPPMLRAFDEAGGKRDCYGLVRRFGYGVPSFERANASARNHVAMVTQAEIQPFRHDSGRKFNECHYYRLPMPARVLEELGNAKVELKVTLSYFIDPNPGLSANLDPQRYQSYGLRFDLMRLNETMDNFVKRVNAAERDDPKHAHRGEPADNRWWLGPNSMSAGSLHCDVWSGPAIELARRSELCVKPVNGWWRRRASKDYCNHNTRYALVVTIKTPNVDVDLYTPIEAILAEAAVEVPW